MQYPGQILRSTAAAVATPGTGLYNLFIDSTSGLLSAKDSNGDVTTVSLGGASKEYTVIVSQTGTGAPTITKLNPGAFAGSVVWARSAEGVYTATCVGGFPADLTFIVCNIDGGAGAYLAKATHTSADVITLETFDDAGAADELEGDVYFSIVTYPA